MSKLGHNRGFIDELYARFQTDPSSVSEAWREYFADYKPEPTSAPRTAPSTKPTAARGKPVVAYKLGRSAVAAELALSHTGALAGEDDVAAAFLADCGIARIFNFETLLEALPLVRRVPARRPGAGAPRVGIVTTTGGGAAGAAVEDAGPGASTKRTTAKFSSQPRARSAPSVSLADAVAPSLRARAPAAPSASRARPHVSCAEKKQ